MSLLEKFKKGIQAVEDFSKLDSTGKTIAILQIKQKAEDAIEKAVETVTPVVDVVTEKGRELFEKGEKKIGEFLGQKSNDTPSALDIVTDTPNEDVAKFLLEKGAGASSEKNEFNNESDVAKAKPVEKKAPAKTKNNAKGKGNNKKR